MRKYHTEGQRYIVSIRVYDNRVEDTVTGFGELFPCLVLTEREERGLPCDDLVAYFLLCYRVMRLEVVPKLSDGAATESSGACYVAGSMSAMSGTQILAWCRRCDCCLGGCGDLRAAFQLKFSVHSFAAPRPLYFT